MTKDEAMKLALDALMLNCPGHKAIAVLREALSQSSDESLDDPVYEPPHVNHEKSPLVTYGVDWGNSGDQPCVCS